MAELSLDHAIQLAVGYHRSGKLVEAERVYLQILSEQPDQVDALHNMGVLAGQDGRFELAITLLRQTLELDPKSASAFGNIGTALMNLRWYSESLEAHRRSVALDPHNAEGQISLAVTLNLLGQSEEAAHVCLRAIQINPNSGSAFNHLGNAYKELGEIELAIESFRRAIELEPGRGHFHSGLVFTSNLHPGNDASRILHECREWADRHERPLLMHQQPHSNDRDPNRRLRIGYVSCDFRSHVVGRNILPLLRDRDRGSFEVFCYSNVTNGDEFTRQFQDLCDHWRPIERLNDSKADEMVRSDQIDILIDLGLHTGGNRLPLFARKPAPVQITFAGYPGTTGLRSIDYRLSDPYLDPPGLTENQYSEKTLRLTNTFWCYDPSAMGLVRDEPVSSLPAIANGYITFGCLNNFSKTNGIVLELWAKVLSVVAGSRLLLLAPEGSARAKVTHRMGELGIEPTRIEFIGRQTRAQYFQTYARIDLALDTVPYNGHTTSLDAMWMGVPTVTLVGDTVVGRAGFSQLSNVGVLELVSRTREQFVNVARDWATDISRLASLRQSLRARMLASPLCNATRFVHSIEEAYRVAWSTWCLSS